jgi:16S rRNA C967 or C1407 C5-methylase (RsmB/RsmF family)
MYPQSNETVHLKLMLTTFKLLISKEKFLDKMKPHPGMRVLDMCAAPGGKTTHIAALMKDTGRVIAIDRREDKVKAITELCKLMNITCVEAHTADSTTLIREDVPKNAKVNIQ